MIMQRLQRLLDRHRIGYNVIVHDTAFSAQQTAHAAHVSGHVFAKTVIVWIDGDPAMAVLPASGSVDLEHLREHTGAKRIRLATEPEFAPLFRDCDVGAMPPFGSLYGMPVYVDPSMQDHEEMVFNAGTHTDLIRMNYRDFVALESPSMVDLCRHAYA